MINEIIEGDEWAAYGTARTYHLDETRDHLRARAYGDRALVVLVGVTPHQGVWESHMQEEAAQGEAFTRERARDVRNLNRPNVATGEPDDTERVLSGSGRGGEKRPSNGTSLAAYFIAPPPTGANMRCTSYFAAI
ncbi:MAG TPA: hypothetical protein VKR06_17585 [Ktedonosporobacter sp.]|nr:hypothetical protein [Ktedonosporobacter sp.]